jgi:hypothetical protein
MLQKIAGHEAQMTLDGSWVPIVTDGEGHIDCLCPHDEILMYPSTQADVERINQARTTSAASAMPKRQLAPASISTNFMSQQSARKTRVNWGDIHPLLEPDKLIHVMTDGGANPNPGLAGWGAIIRQNGTFAWNFGHCSHASNNAMELRAVIEALRNIPDGMDVWVSTDSVSIKRGITEWIQGEERG